MCVYYLYALNLHTCDEHVDDILLHTYTRIHRGIYAFLLVVLISVGLTQAQSPKLRKGRLSLEIVPICNKNSQHLK